MASRGAKRLLERIGRVGLVAVSIMILSSAIAYHAEHPTNPGFATFGDAMWWGIVTLTTVGYGDIVPKTAVGRWAGVVIMITGVAVLGVLAGSLASFFRVRPDGDHETSTDEAPPGSGMPAGAEALVQEMAQLRAQVEHLTELLSARPPDQASGSP